MSNSHPPQATQYCPTTATCLEDDQPHILVAAQHRLYALLLRRASGPIRFWYALRLASDSFFGCIQILLAKKSWGADLGPAYRQLPNGCLVANERSDVRSEGIQKLESRYPWANTVELEMYLEGFDAGEQFASRKMDTLETVVCCSPVASHFKSCPNNPRHNLDIDMLKRLWYKSQYESPERRNASQSD